MPRKCSMYSSLDEETYDSSQQHYSVSHLHRKTRSPLSSRHRNITSMHSPSHFDTRWERHRSPSLSWTRRKRHGSQSRSHSNPRKRQRYSRSHSRDFHTNKEHYRSPSRSKSKGSRSVLTSPHNASGHKGETSLTTEHLKYCSQSSSRYRKGTSNRRNNRSRSHSQTRSKRNESRSLAHSKEWKRLRQRSHSNDSKDIYTHKVKEHYRSRSHSTDSKDIHTHKVEEHYRSQSCSTDSMDIHTNKEHYRSRTPSRSKAQGSHSHMYSRFYSSDIVQRKHHPRSLSRLPIHLRKNCYKLSDTSPQKPCEMSQSRSPYHSR